MCKLLKRTVETKVDYQGSNDMYIFLKNTDVKTADIVEKYLLPLQIQRRPMIQYLKKDYRLNWKLMRPLRNMHQIYEFKVRTD